MARATRQTPARGRRLRTYAAHGAVRGDVASVHVRLVLKILRHEAKAWNRRMNRDQVRINWKFNRKDARRKFRYKRHLSRGQ